MTRNEQPTDLHQLLAQLAPRLDPNGYVFCCLPDAVYGDHMDLGPLAVCREDEGLTLIIAEAQARRAGIEYTTTFRRITLTVQSSLEAVGLTAAVAGELAAHRISANMVAAYYHDHLFVPAHQAERALAILVDFAGRHSA